MTPDDFSVIVPALNEASNIEACVRSATAAGALEVIVVDGGSSDTTWQIAENAGAKVVKSDLGRGVQLNRGVEESQGSVLLFLHADNQLSAGAIAQAAEVCRDDSEAWGGFRQRIDAAGWKYRLLEFGNAMRVRWIGVAFGDQGIFVSRAQFDAMGRFAQVPIMEDVILSKQLRSDRWPVLLGGPVIVSPRRWEKSGVLRRTIGNLTLQLAFKLGVSPVKLKDYYPVNSN